MIRSGAVPLPAAVSRNSQPAALPAAVASTPRAPVADRVERAPAATAAPLLALARTARPAQTGAGPIAGGATQAGAVIRHAADGPAIALESTPRAAARIAAGLAQIRTVDGTPLNYPSQDLTAIESSHPLEHGQTHALTEHVGEDLAANVRRLEAEPQIRAAGGFVDEPHAQLATDRTIANPANQRAIAAFLADPERLKAALDRVDVGTDVGTTTTRADLDAGRPTLIPGRTATVVLIKDRTFPEGYRVLTTYPDTRSPEVDARGNRLP